MAEFSDHVADGPSWEDLAICPLAKTLPAMSDEEFTDVDQEMASKGGMNPIASDRKGPLDRRHRYRAMTEFGKELTQFYGSYCISEFDIAANTGVFVAHKNLFPRNKSPSVRAKEFLEIQNWTLKITRRRERHSADASILE